MMDEDNSFSGLPINPGDRGPLGQVEPAGSEFDPFTMQVADIVQTAMSTTVSILSIRMNELAALADRRIANLLEAMHQQQRELNGEDDEEYQQHCWSRQFTGPEEGSWTGYIGWLKERVRKAEKASDELQGKYNAMRMELDGWRTKREGVSNADHKDVAVNDGLLSEIFEIANKYIHGEKALKAFQSEFQNAVFNKFGAGDGEKES